ncbi:MAG: hypothetical protein IT423_09630 [Pirellulaceae bacterium]|nr:hypothetical protein [Pirellulaceae bacterium]
MPNIELIPTERLNDQLRGLIEAAPVMSLDEGTVDAATAQALANWLKAEQQISRACLAGLWLLAGDLERSHEISQKIDSADGSFWHSIMHRREGDYDNARYWLRRVGSHSVIDQLIDQSSDFRSPFEFLSRVEQAVAKQSKQHELLKHIQWMEWQLLFVHCW